MGTHIKWHVLTESLIRWVFQCFVCFYTWIKVFLKFRCFSESVLLINISNEPLARFTVWCDNSICVFHIYSYHLMRGCTLNSSFIICLHCTCSSFVISPRLVHFVSNLTASSIDWLFAVFKMHCRLGVSFMLISSPLMDFHRSNQVQCSRNHPRLAVSLVRSVAYILRCGHPLHNTHQE